MARCKIYNDYSEFLQFAKIVQWPYRHDDYSSDSWLGDSWHGGTYEQALEKAISGDIALLNRANNVLMDVENVLLPSVEAYRDVSYYYGSRPNISAVIAGQPKSMYRREYVTEPDNHRPIRIFIDRVATSTFSTDEIINRGIAVLALALALKRIRPTTLYVGEAARNRRANADGVVAIALDLNNIDLSVLANALAGASFYRRLLFTANNHLHQVSKPNSHKISVETTRQLLGWSPHDLIFEGMWYNDTDLKLATSDPAKWARNRLEAMSILQNDATE